MVSTLSAFTSRLRKSSGRPLCPCEVNNHWTDRLRLFCTKRPPSSWTRKFSHSYVLRRPKDIVLTVRQMFKQLARSLLQKKALSVEEMADALSLKDNDSTIGDYATALHLLARADVS